MLDYKVLDRHQLEQFVQTNEFEGTEHGAEVSFIVVDWPAGHRVPLHRHAYPEIFIVQEGQATYTVGSATLEVKAPQVIVAAANVPHAFVNSGEGRLKQVDIHVSPRIVTEWLET